MEYNLNANMYIMKNIKMHFRINTAIQMTLFIGFLALISCNNEKQVEIIIDVKHVVNDEELVFENRVYDSAIGNSYRVYTLKYYLSKFVLTDEKGEDRIVDIAHLVDAQDPSSCKIKLNPIVTQNSRRISFIFGLDEITNVEGNLLNNLENNNMIWPIPGEEGYHCMKFEGKYDSMNSGRLKNFHLHTGPTENNLNYVKMELDFQRALSIDSSYNIQLEMNIHDLLHGPNDFDFTDFEHGIMSNQKAQKILKENGKDVFRIISLEGKAI